MNAPITEAALRKAAERVVARGHAIGAVLFGSRARGDAGALSDWDVCLVTDDAWREARGRDRALEADDGFWEDARIDTQWIGRERFDRGVPAGSLEAAIARDGKALAGDTTMARKARTVPFEAETVLANLGRASEHLMMAVNAARRHTQAADSGKRTRAGTTMLTESIAGAEALGRALCALTETAHTGDHRLAKNARQIAERAGEPDPPLEAALMHELSQCMTALDDTVHAVRKIEYGLEGEDREKTIERFIRALEADLQVRQGLIGSVGVWAGLAEHPRREDLAERLAEDTAADAVEIAREWGTGPVRLADDRLDGTVRAWVAGYEALRDERRNER